MIHIDFYLPLVAIIYWLIAYLVIGFVLIFAIQSLETYRRRRKVYGKELFKAFKYSLSHSWLWIVLIPGHIAYRINESFKNKKLNNRGSQ